MEHLQVVPGITSHLLQSVLYMILVEHWLAIIGQETFCMMQGIANHQGMERTREQIMFIVSSVLLNNLNPLCLNEQFASHIQHRFGPGDESDLAMCLCLWSICGGEDEGKASQILRDKFKNLDKNIQWWVLKQGVYPRRYVGKFLGSHKHSVTLFLGRREEDQDEHFKENLPFIRSGDKGVWYHISDMTKGDRKTEHLCRCF